MATKQRAASAFLPGPLIARVDGFKRKLAEYEDRGKWLKGERRALARLLQDAGVPVDQIGRFIRVKQRTHVHAILKGTR